MREYLFKGRPTCPDEEYLEDFNRYFPDCYVDGFVYGNLICDGQDRYIVGGFIEVNDEYTNLEYWVPAIPESVEQVK